MPDQKQIFILGCRNPLIERGQIMKTKIATIMTAMVLFGTIPVQAENKVFTESGEIVDGDIWNMIFIYNDDTIVDMSGGMCD